MDLLFPNTIRKMKFKEGFSVLSCDFAELVVRFILMYLLCLHIGTDIWYQEDAHIGLRLAAAYILIAPVIVTVLYVIMIYHMAMPMRHEDNVTRPRRSERLRTKHLTAAKSSKRVRWDSVTKTS